jgi:hypothetical protein
MSSSSNSLQIDDDSWMDEYINYSPYEPSESSLSSAPSNDIIAVSDEEDNVLSPTRNPIYISDSSSENDVVVKRRTKKLIISENPADT